MKQTSQVGLTTLQIILALTAVAAVFGLIATFSGSSEEQVTTEADEAAESARVTDTPIETFAQNKAEELTESVTSVGSFETYSADKLILAENGTVVLFFYADWCPSCRGLENDLNAKLSVIPDNTHILKLDYDTETELKKKYGVVRQHTLIVVDANGNEIKKLTGLTNTLEQVIGQL